MGEKDPKDETKKNTEREGGEGAGISAEAAAEKECAETKDRLLRMAAEFDNYKKRVAKDIDISKDSGKAEVIARLLPTIDEFELALGSSDEKDEHMKGMALVFSNLISSLKQFGLSEIDAKGKFDPYKHEIVLTRKGSGKEDGVIVEVVRKGYMMNNIMLRPASVIIAKSDAEG